MSEPPPESAFRGALNGITGDSWLDDLARMSLAAAGAKFNPESVLIAANRPLCQICGAALRQIPDSPVPAWWCAACHDIALRENAALREELKEQWEWNHAEHCSNEWPHPEGARCCWPLPVVLGGDPDAWRPGR